MSWPENQLKIHKMLSVISDHWPAIQDYSRKNTSTCLHTFILVYQTHKKESRELLLPLDFECHHSNQLIAHQIA